MNLPVKQFSSKDYSDKFNEIFKSNCKGCSRRIEENKNTDQEYRLDYCDNDCVEKYYMKNLLAKKKSTS